MKRVSVVLLVALSVLLMTSAACMGAPPPQGFAGVTTDGQTIFVGTADGRVLALDASARAANAPFPSAGEWSHAIMAETRGTFGCGTSQVASVLYSNPVVSGDHLCIGTYDGKVQMMEMEARASGAVFPQLRSGEWLFPRTERSIGPVVGSPAISGDRVFVCSSIKQGSRTLGVVYALDRVYGDELWVSEPLDGKLWITPAVVDGVVYVSTFEGRVLALDAATGSVLPWRYESEFGFVSSPFISGRTLYVASFDRSLNAISLHSGQLLWRFEAGNWFWATPLLVDGILYAPSLDGKLYALNAQTGVALWGTPYDVGGGIAAAPVLAGDNIVLVSQKGDVHVVNRSTGLGARVPHPTNEKATTCNAEVVAAPCYLDGMVYIRAQNNVLYVIDPTSRTLAYTFSLKVE